MKDFLGGMVGMNKGLNTEDIKGVVGNVVKNEIMVGCNNVIEQSQKGNNYIIATVGDKIASLPSDVANMVNCVVGDMIDSKLDEKLVGFARMFETRMLEIIGTSNTNNSNQIVCGWLDYDGIAKLANLKSSNGTNLKYHLTNIGVMNKKEGGNFYLTSKNIEDYPYFISNNCKIDKNENRKGKEELFFKPEFVEYIVEKIEEIKRAKDIYELNKAIKDISDKASEIKTNVDKYNDLANVFEEDYRGIISSTIGKYEDNKDKWIGCYSELEKTYSNGLHKEFMEYSKMYKERTGRSASKLYFVIFEKGLAAEMMRIVFDNFPNKATKALKEYQTKRDLENLFR